MCTGIHLKLKTSTNVTCRCSTLTHIPTQQTKTLPGSQSKFSGPSSARSLRESFLQFLKLPIVNGNNNPLYALKSRLSGKIRESRKSPLFHFASISESFGKISGPSPFSERVSRTLRYLQGKVRSVQGGRVHV